VITAASKYFGPGKPQLAGMVADTDLMARFMTSPRDFLHRRGVEP
jgi:hypothetical protein